MAVVSLKIGNGFYKFSCADGQEEHMRALAAELDQRAEALTKSLGFMQQNQMLAMICLLLAQEKNKLEKETNAELLEKSETVMAESLNNLASKITLLAENLQQ